MIKKDNYFYFWDTKEYKSVRIAKMKEDKFDCDLTLIFSEDLSITPYFSDFEKNHKNMVEFTVDKDCLLFNSLLPLTEEKEKISFTSDETKTIHNPTILNDFNSDDYVKISKVDNRQIKFSFYFSNKHILERSIDIKNFLYDGRSYIDHRKSDFKTRFAKVVNNCIKKLNEFEDELLQIEKEGVDEKTQN